MGPQLRALSHPGPAGLEQRRGDEDSQAAPRAGGRRGALRWLPRLQEGPGLSEEAKGAVRARREGEGSVGDGVPVGGHELRGVAGCPERAGAGVGEGRRRAESAQGSGTGWLCGAWGFHKEEQRLSWGGGHCWQRTGPAREGGVWGVVGPSQGLRTGVCEEGGQLEGAQLGARGRQRLWGRLGLCRGQECGHRPQATPLVSAPPCQGLCPWLARHSPHPSFFKARP